MSRIFRLSTIVLALLVPLLAQGSSPHASPVEWRPWSAESFAEAKKQNRLVLLDAAAEWCHWCHVMDATTYTDPKVVELIRTRFWPVRVDVDARPEVAERYGDWGWPATIIFSSSMDEMRKMRGYIAPKRFLEILEGAARYHDRTKGKGPFGDDPPGPLREVSALTPARVARLRKTHEDELSTYFDRKAGGWGFRQKSSTWMNVEHAFGRLASTGTPYWRFRALFTLERLVKIMDPVWGGVYQYSTDGDWDHPHYEKLMTYQAGTLESYAQAANVTGEPAYLETARKVHGYMTNFLCGPDGAFYATQDADLQRPSAGGPTIEGGRYYALDDKGRRALGLPRIDTNVYARENGLAIAAICQLYSASGRPAELAGARRAAERVLASHRARGGVAHSDGEKNPLLHLADNAAFGRGLLALYEATGEARWFDAAAGIADAMVRELLDAKTGAFWAHSPDPAAVGVLKERRYPVDDNVAAGRFFLRLAAHEHAEPRREVARRTLAWVSAGDRPEEMGRFAGAYLSFLEESQVDPLHVTVVGRSGDPAADKLVMAAHRFPHVFKIVERYDPADPRRRTLIVEFPELDRAAAFSCANGTCSAPIEDPGQLGATLTRLTARRAAP